MSQEDITDIKDRLDRIEHILLDLTKKIDLLNNSCSRMDSHINFVEDTYENFKNPLKIIKERVEGIFGTKAIEEIKE